MQKEAGKTNSDNIFNLILPKYYKYNHFKNYGDIFHSFFVFSIKSVVYFMLTNHLSFDCLHYRVPSSHVWLVAILAESTELDHVSSSQR